MRHRFGLDRNSPVTRSRLVMPKNAHKSRLKFCVRLRSEEQQSKRGLNRHIDLPKKMPRHLEQRTGIAFTRRKIISKRNAERTQCSKRVIIEKRSRSAW